MLGPRGAGVKRRGRLVMAILILGLVLFLGVHSVRVLADGWRSRTMGRIGEGPWKGLYSLVAAAGLGLVIWGFSLARRTPELLWLPLPGAAHIAAVLTLLAFILFTAAYIPGNRIRAVVGNPMILSVAVWAFAHLLANGYAHDLLLFGG